MGATEVFFWVLFSGLAGGIVGWGACYHQYVKNREFTIEYDDDLVEDTENYKRILEEIRNRRVGGGER